MIARRHATRPGSRSARRGAGFTLIEVLVSIAIFALAAVVLGSAYVNVLSGYHRMRGSTLDDSDVAFVRGIVLAEPKREVVEKGGDVRRADQGTVHWHAEIEPTNRADLFRVTIECELPTSGPGPARRISNSFLVLRPTWSEAIEREKLRAKFREELVKRKS